LWWHGLLVENHKNCTPDRRKASSSCQLRRKQHCNIWNDSNILCCHAVNSYKILKLEGTRWPRWSSAFNADELHLKTERKRRLQKAYLPKSYNVIRTFPVVLEKEKKKKKGNLTVWWSQFTPSFGYLTRQKDSYIFLPVIDDSVVGERLA